MDEWIDILDLQGNYTRKRALKSEAHRKGLFHPTVHVWFHTQDGLILLQQRAKNKDTYPLRWDVSVAGHVGAGEQIMEAALREVEEEIGLNISKDDLAAIGTFKSVQAPAKDILDCEFHHTFICFLGVGLNELKKQGSEVADLKLITINEMEKELLNPELSKTYVPHETDYYMSVLKAIKKRL